MSDRSPNEARERVLDAAERLFARHGYTAVTLRDIGAAAGIRHASLYYHVPGGKEALFIEVTERNLRRHRAGLARAVAGAPTQIRAQLHAVADWLLAHPPLDLVRMAHSDMPAIDPHQAHRLTNMAHDAMILPLQAALEQARERGEIRHHDLGLIAGGLLGMIESLHALPDGASGRGRQEMAYDLVDTLLDGLRK